jgi:hypothetical protein
LKDKKIGSAAVKQTDPKRKNENLRQLNFNGIKIGNQRIIWRFDKENPNLSFDQAEAVMEFVNWLQKNRYIIRRKN